MFPFSWTEVHSCDGCSSRQVSSMATYIEVRRSWFGLVKRAPKGAFYVVWAGCAKKLRCALCTSSSTMIQQGSIAFPDDCRILDEHKMYHVTGSRCPCMKQAK